jgi:hypothetical protein
VNNVNRIGISRVLLVSRLGFCLGDSVYLVSCGNNCLTSYNSRRCVASGSTLGRSARGFVDQDVPGVEGLAA